MFAPIGFLDGGGTAGDGMRHLPFALGKGIGPAVGWVRRQQAGGTGEQALHQPLPDPEAAVSDHRRYLRQDFRCRVAVAVTGGPGRQRREGVVFTGFIGKNDQRLCHTTLTQGGDLSRGLLAGRHQHPDQNIADKRFGRTLRARRGEGGTPGIAQPAVCREEELLSHVASAR